MKVWEEFTVEIIDECIIEMSRGMKWGSEFSKQKKTEKCTGRKVLR